MVEPCTFVTMCRANFGKLFSHIRFVFARGNMERAGVLVGDLRCIKHLKPQVTALRGQIEHLSGNLSDWPEHAEVGY